MAHTASWESEDRERYKTILKDQPEEPCGNCGQPIKFDDETETYVAKDGSQCPSEDGHDPLGSTSHEAGILDWLDRKLAPTGLVPEQGGRWSFDWCRYRHNSHCFYPAGLDAGASSQAGYAVWTPQDRGSCPRFTWESQQQCPIGAPGPHAGGTPDAYTQQQPVQPRGLLQRLLGSKDAKDEDFHWHFCAKWADVRAKAARIRREGGVRIISAPDARNPYITAEVKGDNHTYQTTILRSIGGKSVAGWECTCAWAHYAWGRSGRWKKFEGRQCSHALATIYQAQADEMFGGRVKEISRQPATFDQPGDEGQFKKVWQYDPDDEKRKEYVERDWRKDPTKRSGKAPEWVKQYEGSLRVIAQETEQVKVGDVQPGDRVLLTGYEKEGPHTVKSVRDGTPAKRIEPYEDKKERTLRGIIEHDDPDHYPPKDYGTIPIRHFDLAGTFDHIALPHHAPIKRLTASLSFSEERPIAMEAEARLEAGESPQAVLSYLRAADAPWPEYILTEALHKPFVARDPADELHTIVSLEGEHAVTDNGDLIPAEHLTHPDFDWHSGLSFQGQAQTNSAEVQQDPVEHVNADGSPHNGVMVALVPPEKVREGLAVQDGEAPEDMHVTVGYLGKKDSVDPEALHRAVSSFAQQVPPLKGKISGFGNFEVDPERNDGFSHAHVGLVDIPGISDFQAKLDEHLGREGLKVNNEHGLQPHLTVAYGHEPAEYDSMPDTTDHFDLPHITVAHGGTWTHYPLQGSPEAQKTGMLRWARGPVHGPILNPHWQSPEAPKGRSKGRADDPNATKFSTYEPKFQEKIANQFHSNVPSELGINTHRDMVENIKGMYREAKATNPKAIREGKKWYSDAHNFAKGLAQKHPGGKLRTALGMTAALSPQNHWEENKTQAEYIHHHLSADPDSEDGRFNISHEDAQAAMKKQSKQASVKKGYRQVQQLTPGKRFADMEPEEAAHSLKAQAQYTHKLKVPGRIKNDGDPWKATFANGTGSIAKAVRIHRGEDPDDVLQGHKVRSFFNNMADHTNKQKRDDVTIDTHAVSLAAGAKFGASAPELKKMFANGANKNQNVTGTYGYVADAYRQAHKELQDSGEMSKTSAPHHLQATTWLHWRDINDEPGKLKEANKGRFKDYSGENAARNKRNKELYGEDYEGDEDEDEGMSAAASLHVAQGHDIGEAGKLLDPSNYDENAADPDFDPDLAEDALDAEWDAEPAEMEQRWQDSQAKQPRTSMLRWGAVQGDDMDTDDVDSDTSDEMADASAVQKQYADQADDAQDDFYFNYPTDSQSPFPNDPNKVPPYMSATPHGAMLHWARPRPDRLFDVSDIPTKKGPYQEPRSNPNFEHPYEGPIGKYLYHHSPPENRSSIMEHGLQPRDPQESSAKGSDIPSERTPEGVYLGPYDHIGPHQRGSDVWAVDTNKVRLHQDPDDDENYWGFHYSEDPVPPEAMKLVHRHPSVAMLHWSAEAAEEMLRDEPEGALPSTDGGAPSELWESQHSTTAPDPISAGPAGFGSPLDPGSEHEDMGYPEADEAVLRPSGGPGAGSFMNEMENKMYGLDYASSLHAGTVGQQSRAWLLQADPHRSAGGDQGIRDSDIAAMARQFLQTGEVPGQSKVAAKVFSPAEQVELIQEGSADGTRASNLDRLQLEGTHYLADEDDEDLDGLFG
jgi:2'-5' RNA ligase